MISSSQNEEMSSGIDEMEVELDAGGNSGIIGFSLCIAKISQGLRKFRKDCEIFTTIAKISQSLRNFRYAHFFAMIAKFLYHNESYCAWGKF